MESLSVPSQFSHQEVTGPKSLGKNRGFMFISKTMFNPDTLQAYWVSSDVKTVNESGTKSEPPNYLGKVNTKSDASYS